MRERVGAIVVANGWGAPPSLDELLSFESADLGVDEAIQALQDRGLDAGHCADLEAILRVQERFPKYELTQLLEHADADGLVFAARHLPSARLVSMTAASWSESAQMRRFLSEARLLTSLRHPNCARFVDAGESKGFCQFAVERIDEPTFELVIQQGGLTETRILDIVRQLAAGLAAQAKAGVLHRMVTPAVLRVPRAWLADAQRLPSRITDPGILRGIAGLKNLASSECPDYLAPEQVRGQGVDERTVVYNCGAILYHALCGSPPFAGSSPSLVRKAHLFENVPDIGSLNPEVGSSTRRLISTAMRKAQADRFKDLDAFVAAIDAALCQLGAVATTVDPRGNLVSIAPADDATGPTAAIPALQDYPFEAASVQAASKANAPQLTDSAANEAPTEMFSEATTASPAATTPDDVPTEVRRRILQKHETLKSERAGTAPIVRPLSIVSQSFLAGAAPSMDVLMGIIMGNGWVAPEGHAKLREFFRSGISTLRLRMRRGVGEMLVARDILTVDQAREFDLTLQDQTLVPNYRLSRILSQGPSSRTYEALHAAAGTPVALTLFQQPDASKRQRFLTDFASLMRLKDHRIAPAIECGHCGTSGDRCFAASELIIGESLDTTITGETSMPERSAIRLTLQVLSALAVVHEQTARCHLALRPSNIIIVRESRHGRDERIVLTDLGVSEHLQRPASRDLDFRAPETRYDAPGDMRSDIFSLGMILQRLLNPSAPRRPPCDPGQGINRHAREAVLTATHYDPARRYQDYESFRTVLAQASHDLAEEFVIFPDLALETFEPSDTQIHAPVSSRILRRHHSPGPKNDFEPRNPRSALPGLEKRPRSRPPDR